MTQRERIAAPREERAPKLRSPVPATTGLLALQRTAGNQAVVRMLARSPAGPPAYAPLAAAQVRVEDGAKASTKMGPDQWGLTWPESIDVTIDAHKDGSSWRPVVTDLVGRFSVQSRLLPGVRQVRGPGRNTTEANFRQQIADLNSLAPPGQPVQWYMIEAVEAHEAVHARLMDPAFQAIAPRTIAALEAVTIQDDGRMDAKRAAHSLEKDPAFTQALADRLFMWQLDTGTAGLDDHDPSGPTKAAERVVVDQMILAIRAEAAREGWPP
jgi:hypothetical protein